MAWAETPPSRTRHFITNVEVMGGEADGTLQVRSNFLIYRSHLEYDQELFSGFREDTLRPDGDRWKVARRDIVLDASVVMQKSLGVFF
jgi:biphenyl 2,3-dioxygenase beta subunit